MKIEVEAKGERNLMLVSDSPSMMTNIHRGDELPTHREIDVAELAQHQ